MLLDDLISKPEEYPHVVSAVQHSHRILINTENAFLVHCPVSNVFIAEFSGTDIASFVNEIKKHKVVRLQTTSRILFETLKNDFSVNYQCVQATYPDGNFTDSNLELIMEKDLPYAAESYGLEKYIYQLFRRNRLFALYENEKIMGYVAYHIDESTGALYVDPAFRNKGLGAKLLEAAFKNYKDGIRFSQIVNDNIPSIRLHEKLGCKISPVPLYWVYNEDFLYEE